MSELDQFANETLAKCYQTQNSWFASIRCPEKYNTLINPVFESYGHSYGDAVRKCADKIRHAWDTNEHKFKFWHGYELIHFWKEYEQSNLLSPVTHLPRRDDFRPTYEGWSSQEVWTVAYTIDNDQSMQTKMLDLVRGLMLKEGKRHTQRGPIWGTPMVITGTRWAAYEVEQMAKRLFKRRIDFYVYNLSASEWEEIYEHFKAKAQEGL